MIEHMKEDLDSMSVRVRGLVETEVGKEHIERRLQDFTEHEFQDPRETDTEEISIREYISTMMADTWILGEYIIDEYDVELRETAMDPGYLLEEADTALDTERPRKDLTQQDMWAMISVYKTLGSQYDERIPENVQHPLLMEKNEMTQLIESYTNDLKQRIEGGP